MDLNKETILKLPNSQKIALVAFIFLALGAGFFYGLFQPKMKELSALQQKQADLSRQIQENKRIADNLPKFKKDYEQLKIDLDNALTELPNQKEIPSLLTSILEPSGRGVDPFTLTMLARAQLSPLFLRRTISS